MNRHLLFYITIALFSIRILPVSGDMDIPPLAMEVLEKKGITIADLQNNPELRKKWLRNFRDMGGKKENDKTSGKHSRPEGVGVDLNPAPQFYKVVIDNNLFRPLGYRRAKPGPPFELIATVVDRNWGGSKALIRSNADRQVYYVGVGEEFAGAKVEMIEPLKVKVFHHGKSQEFRASTGEFLGGRGDDRKPSSRMRNGESAPKSGRRDSNSGGRDFNFEGMERKLRDLPPEARKKLMRQMMRKLREASEGKHREDRDDGSAEKKDRDDNEEKEDDERGGEKRGK